LTRSYEFDKRAKDVLYILDETLVETEQLFKVLLYFFTIIIIIVFVVFVFWSSY